MPEWVSWVAGGVALLVMVLVWCAGRIVRAFNRAGEERLERDLDVGWMPEGLDRALYEHALASGLGEDAVERLHDARAAGLEPFHVTEVSPIDRPAVLP